MKRVTGIGGIFFQSADPEKLAAWYKKHLWFGIQDWGGVSFQEGAVADLRNGNRKLSGRCLRQTPIISSRV